MTTQAASRVRELTSKQRGLHFGAAHVVAVTPNEVTVELRGGECVRAEMALSIPYAPVLDDILLVIGEADEHYVIGVIRGAGKTSLSFQGAVEVRAEGGPLTLVSDRGVNIQAPEVEIETGGFRMFAGAVVQTCTSLLQRVRGALNVHAGKAHTVIEDASFLTAKNATIVTEETVNINGQEIHLG